MSWLSAGWTWYASNSDKINPIVAALGGAALVWAAVRQARTATNRHYEQTRADQQRRLTESFSKAVEQLASDKIEARLGGIYTLERLAIEAIAEPRPSLWQKRLRRSLGRGPTSIATDEYRRSPEPVSDLYWTVMETLTAFVRERARWKASTISVVETTPVEPWQSKALSMQIQSELVLATDIAAVVEVIRRRPEAGWLREKTRGWRLDFSGADLRGANLYMAHLENAILYMAHLEGAFLFGANLEAAWLLGAHLEGANLSMTRLASTALNATVGNSNTVLPDGVDRPIQWPPYDSGLPPDFPPTEAIEVRQ